MGLAQGEAPSWRMMLHNFASRPLPLRLRMKILLIQTAFLGDVVLATPLIERLRATYPEATLDFLLRKGNQALLTDHPHLRRVWVWDKQAPKRRELLRLLRGLRAERYDYVINAQRFFTTGLLTVLAGARVSVGFDKNPLAWAFTRRVSHRIDPQQPTHEVQRNLALLDGLVDPVMQRPKLYCTAADYAAVAQDAPYVCLAPASVWATKQWPASRWVELIGQLPAHYRVLLIGGPGDRARCEDIAAQAQSPRVQVLAGQLTLLQSAALIERAAMTYTNDSAPLHLASAMNAPVTAIFCSTIPAFGFGPLSDQGRVVETAHDLPCRPCGLHGRRACPEGHFRCAEIEVSRVVGALG